MYCNNYAPDLEFQVGEQPIRVFTNYSRNIFGDIYNEISKEFPQCVEVTGDYSDGKFKAISPHVLFGRVRIQESFLSLMWCLCYGILTTSPIREIPTDELQKGTDLLKYGLSLMDDYTEWNKEELPNPEYYEKKYHEPIGKANAVYLIALNFIIYHEFAHCVFNDSVSSVENEKRADLFALKKVWALIENDEDRITITLGILTGLASLLLLSNRMKGINHPDPDDRITYVLEELNFSADHLSWGYATMSFLLWKKIHFGEWEFPNKFESFKDFYYRLIENVKAWKEKK